MPKPNFFIVGAPKCGTTALSVYLREHPNVFISKSKEPHYFAFDLPKYRIYKTENEYLRLFDDALENYIAIGEASVFYMYSDVAVKNIYKFNPNSKIIVMLRNPVQVVYSMHSQLLYTRDEDVNDFSKAWELIEQRRLGYNIPKYCRDRKLLYYNKIAKFGDQLERILNIFPEERLKIIFFEDFVSNTSRIYNEVLYFLEVPQKHRGEFPKINENKRHKLDWLANFTQRPPKILINVAKTIKNVPGVKKGLLCFMEIIRSANRIQSPRQELSIKLRSELIDEYSDDIIKLSRITGRDLSQWLSL